MINQIQAKQNTVISMYNSGYAVGDIQAVTKYTQAMVYHILQKNGISTRRAKASTADIEYLVRSGYCRLKTSAKLILQYVAIIDNRPSFIAGPEDLKMMGLIAKKQKQVRAQLQALSIHVAIVPFPMLQSGDLYFPLTFKELVFMHADCINFLVTNSARIKEGWKSKSEGYSK